MRITALILCFLLTNYPIEKGVLNPVVQFDIHKILNARPVTTLTHNRLITWTKGVDGNGLMDGYLTQSAAAFNGDKNPHALPDNSLFSADEKHPEIKLHYSNDDSLHNQAYNITGKGNVEFSIPKAAYKDVYLALTSAEGSSAIQITFTYTDGIENKDFTIPDYYKDIPADDPDFCYLAHDLAKWGNKNNMTEKDHHNIDLLNIHPDPKRTLKGIKIEKSQAGYLAFWAAAGIKAG